MSASSSTSASGSASGNLAVFSKGGRNFRVLRSEWASAKGDDAKKLGSGGAAAVYRLKALPATASGGAAAGGAPLHLALKVSSSSAKDSNLAHEASTLRQLTSPHHNVVQVN